MGFLFFSSQTVFRFFPCKTTTQQQQQLFYAEINTLHSCFFSFFLPSETPFTSFTKEKQQKRQQLLVFMQRRFENLPLLLLPLKLFPHYSPKNNNKEQQQQQLLNAKKIKAFASSSSASSSQTISTLFTKKHQPRTTTTTSLCKEDQNICFLSFFFLLLLSHSLHILHKTILTKAATATSVSKRSKTFLFLPCLPNYLHLLHKNTPTTTTATSLCEGDQNWSLP